MAIIVPTITAEEPHTYRSQIENVQVFAKRLHIDLMDGVFTHNKSIEVNQVWWPENTVVDIHLMFQNPEAALSELITLKPDTVVIHAETDCDIESFAKRLNQAGIHCGLAVFPETSIESVGSLLTSVQQLLIFSGNLGHQGGSTADLGLLKKIAEAKAINPNLGIAWDGGVNDLNISELANAGIDIINVGGFIQLAPDAGVAYNALVTLLP